MFKWLRRRKKAVPPAIPTKCSRCGGKLNQIKHVTRSGYFMICSDCNTSFSSLSELKRYGKPVGKDWEAIESWDGEICYLKSR